ncbi:MAG TPA: hypothetical protein VFV38_00150 [Ktedonobacteraceae bacterium]|nr:hypothetical protein [Ktedonobacteraceae bacterium]
MRQTMRLSSLLSLLTALLMLTGCGSRSTSGPAPTPSPGRGSVTLHIDAPSYRVRDPISVTVDNQSTQTISFPDHLTNCTVIQLQRQRVQPADSDGGQGGISPCLLDSPTRMHQLGPGQRLLVKLTAPQGGWPPGLYRAMLSYHAPLPTSPATTCSSPSFTVGPLAPQP